MFGSRRLVLFLLCAVPCLVIAGEAEPQPPFVGEVTGTHVRIRAGGSVSYTILAIAEKGQRVQVRERREGWLGIAIPEKCTVWVSKSMLTLEPDGKQATVAKDKVNIRARGNPTADVIGQLADGAKVRIAETEGDWCGIAAPPEVMAWIDGRYVRKVEGAAVAEPGKAQVPEPVKEPGKETAKEPAKEGAKEAVKVPVPTRTVEVGEASALLRKAQERYAAELAKPPKDRDFGEVLSMYQKVASECGDAEVARQAEAARQRLLKIVDIHQALQAAREPIEQFDKKYNKLEEEFMRKVEGAPKEPKEKVEPKPDEKAEPKAEEKAEAKAEPKAEVKEEPKEQPKEQPKGEPKGDLKPEEKQP